MSGKITFNKNKKEEKYDLIIDDISESNITYIGKAIIGSSLSSPVWQIQKINESSGLILGWADSNTKFDNIWDDRINLIYSQ